MGPSFLFPPFSCDLLLPFWRKRYISVTSPFFFFFFLGAGRLLNLGLPERLLKLLICTQTSDLNQVQATDGLVRLSPSPHSVLGRCKNRHHLLCCALVS